MPDTEHLTHIKLKGESTWHFIARKSEILNTEHNAPYFSDLKFELFQTRVMHHMR